MNRMLIFQPINGNRIDELNQPKSVAVEVKYHLHNELSHVYRELTIINTSVVESTC